MTALGWVLLGAVGGLIAGMALAAAIAQRFLLLGREERDRYQEIDPDDIAGRLPSETVGESTGRHAVDRPTESIPAVRDDDLLAPEDSVPGRRFREMAAIRPEWPEDMPDVEREWINEDSRRVDTVDAADRGERQ